MVFAASFAKVGLVPVKTPYSGFGYAISFRVDDFNKKVSRDILTLVQVKTGLFFPVRNTSAKTSCVGTIISPKFAKILSI